MFNPRPIALGIPVPISLGILQIITLFDCYCCQIKFTLQAKASCIQPSKYYLTAFLYSLISIINIYYDY